MKAKQVRDLLRQLRSVEIDGEEFFVVEGDLLMTERELRALPSKRLQSFVACQRAAEFDQEEPAPKPSKDTSDIENKRD